MAEFFEKDTSSKILAKLTPEKRFQLIGEVTSLFLSSEFYRKFRILDLALWVLPAIDHNQFKLYKKGDKPIAYVGWAYLTEEVEKKYLSGEYTLRYEDWNAGDRLWVVDFTAPFGDAQKVILNFKKTIVKGRHTKAIRVNDEGKIIKVMKFHKE